MSAIRIFALRLKQKHAYEDALVSKTDYALCAQRARHVATEAGLGPC
jgi:hypothetical protein